MAVAIEVTLPNYLWVPDEFRDGTQEVMTNRVIVMFSHLWPSRGLIANSDATVRFSQGQSELGYDVGSTISVGQPLGH